VRLVVEFEGERYRVADRSAYDLSIPLRFGGGQPNAFGAPAATSRPLRERSFVGDTRSGGSCNCEAVTLVAHGNGTHTECMGHVTEQRVSVRDAAAESLLPAALVSVPETEPAASGETSEPHPQPTDRLVTRAALEAAWAAIGSPPCAALVVRTLPNPAEKRFRTYAAEAPPPFFTAEAMHFVVALGVQHLVVDLPSVDRIADAGYLTGHRIFWGLPPGARDAGLAARRNATITELAFVPAAAADGVYLLNLQVAPFASDAAPSRPLLYSLEAL